MNTSLASAVSALMMLDKTFYILFLAYGASTYIHTYRWIAIKPYEFPYLIYSDEVSFPVFHNFIVLHPTPKDLSQALW